MIKILRDNWAKNEGRLREAISQIENLYDFNYTDLVKLTFLHIYAPDAPDHCGLNLEQITTIDDGDYQGTLVFLIPFDTYQPTPDEYLMTYIGYGSCSVCDPLERIQDMGERPWNDQVPPTEEQIKDLLSLCEAIVCNTIKPYNYGWRHSEVFETVEMEEKSSNA